MATENGAVELGIQSPSTGAKLGQEMEGGAWEGVSESRAGQVPQRSSVLRFLCMVHWDSGISMISG